MLEAIEVAHRPWSWPSGPVLAPDQLPLRADHVLSRAAHGARYGAEYPEDHSAALQHRLGLSVRRAPGQFRAFGAFKVLIS